MTYYLSRKSIEFIYCCCKLKKTCIIKITFTESFPYTLLASKIYYPIVLINITNEYDKNLIALITLV